MKECHYQKSLKKIIFSYLTDRNPNFLKISDKILKIIKKETESRYGFAGYLDDKTGWLIVPTLSKNVVEECRVDKKNLIFKNFDTVYGIAIKSKKPFLSNDLPSDMKERSLPEGHVKMKSFLAVPAVIKNKTVGILAVADKKEGYSKKEVAFLSVMAGFYAMIVYNLLNLKRIEEQNETLRQIIENARDIIYMVDSSGKIEYMNKRYKYYGYEESDIIGRHVSEFSHKDDLSYVMKAFSSALKTGKTKDVIKYRIMKKDGSFFYADQKSSVIFKNGKPYKIIGSIRDSGKERELVSKLASQKEILNKIYENAPDMMYIKNIDGIYVGVNKACSLFLKKPKKEIIGKSDSDIFGKELSEKIRIDDIRVAAGETVNAVYEWNGRTVNVIKAPIKDDDGKVKFILSMGRDISRIKKMENELALMKAKEKIKKITSDLSHDINNTLAVMSGYTALISESAGESLGEKAGLKIIDKSIKKAANIVKVFRKKIEKEKL
ncbi:MAG: PAS domain S-box protein [Elusimicrobia bacterium]|nr:PAS domain S-box protein [Elusimicrobiota bacterium]